MAERIVRLVVERLIDGADPLACSPNCPALPQWMAGHRKKCMTTREFLVPATHGSPRLLRTPQCLASESQPEEKP